jgi:hypothetical protein
MSVQPLHFLLLVFAGWSVVSRRPITTLLAQPHADVTASDAERVNADPRRGETSIVR